MILKELLSYSAKIQERIAEIGAIAGEACDEWWKFYWLVYRGEATFKSSK